MATRTSRKGLFIGAGFIGDQNSIARLMGGRQIDWDNVPESFRNERGVKVLPAGTVVGDALDAESVNTNRVSPRVVTTNPGIGILETTAVEDDRSAALSGYGIIVGGVILEDTLPDTNETTFVLDAAIKTELDTAGCQFIWQNYGIDTRVPLT